MKLSVSLSSDNLDEYRIGLETINSGFLSDKVFEILKDVNRSSFILFNSSTKIWNKLY